MTHNNDSPIFNRHVHSHQQHAGDKVHALNLKQKIHVCCIILESYCFELMLAKDSILFNMISAILDKTGKKLETLADLQSLWFFF